jgi:hypothetical protein
MKSLFRRHLPCFSLLMTFLTGGCAQQVVAPPPPPPPPPAVISKVTSAKKIFLSNAGVDAEFLRNSTAGANGSYDELYAALKQWGYFQLVDSPTQADIILEIRSTETRDFTEEYDPNPSNVSHTQDILGAQHPVLTLSILNASTRSLIWKIVSPAGFAGSKKKGAIAFTQSIGVLTDKIKALVAGPAPTQNP